MGLNTEKSMIFMEKFQIKNVRMGRQNSVLWFMLLDGYLCVIKTLDMRNYNSTYQRIKRVYNIVISEAKPQKPRHL